MKIIESAKEYITRKLFGRVIDRLVAKSLMYNEQDDYETDDYPTPMQMALSQAYRVNVWVYACQSVLAFDASQVPPVIKKIGKRENGRVTTEVINDHEAYALLDKPNGWQGWPSFIEEVMLNLLQWGRVAIEKGGVSNGDDAIKGFKCLSSKYIDVKTSSNPDEMFSRVIYRRSTKEESFSPEEVVFIKRHDVDMSTVKGLSPNESARLSIGIQLGMQQLMSSVIEKSPWASFVLGDSGGQPYTKEQVMRIYGEIDHRVGGPMKAGLPLIVHGLKAQPVKNALSDVPFTAIGSENRDQILAAYGVPPGKVGILDDASYANAAEMDRRYWTQTIPPWLNLIYDALTRQWIADKWPDVWLEPDYSAMGVNTQSQRDNMKAAEEGFIAGVMSLDEARARCGLEPDKANGTKYSWELKAPAAAGFGGAAGGAFGAGKVDGEKPADVSQYVTEQEGKFVATSRTGRRIGVYATRQEAEDAVRSMMDTAAKQKGMKPMQKRRLDDDDVEALSNAVGGAVDDNEAGFQSWAKSVFDAQMDLILKELDKAAGRKGVKKDMSDDEKKRLRDLRVQEMLNEVAKQFNGKLADSYVKTLRQSAEDSIDAMGFGTSFNVRDPKIAKWVSEKIVRLSAQVSETTELELKKAIRAGLDAGEDYDQIRDRVVGALGDQMAPSHRPMTIARTEGIDAANFGAFESFQQSGMVKGMEWLATGDDRTRPTHVMANGQVRPLGEPFSVGGSELRWPGDSELGAEPEEICGCRCTVIPVLL